MEFAEGKARQDRKILSQRGWTLEYCIDFTSSAGKIDRADVADLNSVRPVFAFHGFARPLEDFIPILQLWPEDCAFISVHLPHHGKSGPDTNSKKLDDPIEPKDLLALLTEVAKSEGLRINDFDLLGYSIGGRIALSLIALEPKKWKRIVLLAPDGLKKSPFYGLTVHTLLGKAIWFAIDRNSPLVLRWANQLNRRKLISSHMHAFIAFHLSSHAMRMMVWNGWRTHRKCWPSHRKMLGAFESIEGTVDIFFGDHDRIIPVKNSHRLRKITQHLPHVRFHSIPTGHGMLREEALQLIIQRTFKP